MWGRQVLSMAGQAMSIIDHYKDGSVLVSAVLTKLFFGVLLTVLLLLSGNPQQAIAKPLLLVGQPVSSFTLVTQSGVHYFRSSESGSALVEIFDSTGRLVWKKPFASIKKSTRYKAVWNGRASKANLAGYQPSDYVKPGTYGVTVTIVSKTGTSVRSKRIRVKSSPRPKIAILAYPKTMTPSVDPRMASLKVKFTLSHKNDAFLYVRSNETAKTIARIPIRNAPAAKAGALQWNGRISVSKSVRLQDGSWAAVGEPAPPGAYTMLVVSNGNKISKKLTIKPIPVTKVSVKTTKARLRYKKTLSLAPTILPSCAYDKSLQYSSSNDAIARVDSNGVITAGQQEGTAKISVVSQDNSDAGTDVTVTVSDSTLKVANFLALPKWLIYKNSRKIAGVVSSNYPLGEVKIVVRDVASGKHEISKTVLAEGAKSLDIGSVLNPIVKFGVLTAGEKEILVRATDELCARIVYRQKFLVIGPTRYQSFWSDRLVGVDGQQPWVFPLNVDVVNGKKKLNISSFGSVRDGGARAHAAIDFIEPAGTKVYAMADGVVERISVGTYYAGTGAVQVRHTDGAVIWYCEVKAASKLKVGDKVKQNQVIATIQKNNYGTAMLHLEAYSGKASGNLYNGSNVSTYDNVTPVRFLRRRDLVYPHGVMDLPIPDSRVIAPNKP